MTRGTLSPDFFEFFENHFCPTFGAVVVVEVGGVGVGGFIKRPKNFQVKEICLSAVIITHLISHQMIIIVGAFA